MSSAQRQRPRRVIFHVKRFPRGNQGWQKRYPGLRSALMQNPRKRIKSLQLSCQAANSSRETPFSAPFALRIFLKEKPWGRGSRKDALLRCDTHDMRRLLRRYLICFCLFQSGIFSGTVLPTDEERARATHTHVSRSSVVSVKCTLGCLKAVGKRATKMSNLFCRVA